MANFTEKFNSAIQSSVKQVWDNLTKEELLAYLQSQEQVTADYLRTMLSNEGICLQFGALFNCAALK